MESKNLMSQYKKDKNSLQEYLTVNHFYLFLLLFHGTSKAVVFFCTTPFLKKGLKVMDKDLNFGKKSFD